MTQEEKRKYYENKPKHILVLDCVYLDEERTRLEKTNHGNLILHNQMTADMQRLRNKNAILQDTVTKLMDILKTFKDQMGI